MVARRFVGVKSKNRPDKRLSALLEDRHEKMAASRNPPARLCLQDLTPSGLQNFMGYILIHLKARPLGITYTLPKARAHRALAPTRTLRAPQIPLQTEWSTGITTTEQPAVHWPSSTDFYVASA